MSSSQGPVQAKSLVAQQSSGGGGSPTNGFLGDRSPYGPGGMGSLDPSSLPGYYSTSNPFAVAPSDTGEDDNRRDRYLRDRMTPENQYGGPGMVGRLMTA